MRAALSRYSLVVSLLLYMAAILVIHRMGLFPRAGLYDLARLQGSATITVEGVVEDIPLLKWGQTRFRLEGCAVPLSAFCGSAMVTLPMLVWDLAPGDRIAVRGWLSKPKPGTEGYWSSRHVFTFFKVWHAESFQLLERSAPWSLRRCGWRFQQAYREFWEGRLPWKEGALLLGVTVGAKGILPPSVKEACIRAGVYHIVVVSGQNMSLLINLGLVILFALAVPKRYAIWICMPLILFYSSAVGADPPVIRAAVTAVVGLVVSALGRDIPSVYPLAIAAGWILVQEPEALLGASFQLSFGATLRILLIVPLLNSTKGRWGNLRRWLAQSLFLGVGVYVGIWPLLAFYFHRISLAGLLANWTVFPLSGCLMVLGLVVGAWGVTSPATVPAILVAGIEGLLKIMLKLIEHMASWSWAACTVPAVPAWGIALYYGSLFAILIFVHRRKNIPSNDE